VARPKDRRPSWVRDPADRRSAGGAVLVEADLVLPAPAVRAEDLDRAASGDPVAGRADRTGPQWAFEQVGDYVGDYDAAVSTVAAQLGVAWWTVMDQVIDRGTPSMTPPDSRPPTGLERLR